MLSGKCHCGNIAFDVAFAVEPAEISARACGCSFCVKHGGIWTSDPSARLVVRIGDPAIVTRYVFGTKTAIFHVCSRCGVVPVVTSDIDAGVYAVVNVNTLEGVESSRLRRASANFEGETMESRLVRRKRNWIGDVSFERASALRVSTEALD